MGTMKICCRCKLQKNIKDFNKNQGYCRTCQVEYNNERKEKRAEYSRSWRVNNPDKSAAIHRKHNYGISPEQYEALLIAQNYVCASCGLPEKGISHKNGKIRNLSVDHDKQCCPGRKSCGKCVRGLLCLVCNIIIGHMEINPNCIFGAINYLKDYNE